jgi:ankyrin repeat protein
MTTVIATGDPRVVAAVDAIHTGDVAFLRQLLAEHPELTTAALGTTGPGGMTRTLLHVVTDFPGHWPNGPRSVDVLVQAGADVNARFTGPHTETPLHWAASSNDVPVLDALLDHGADIEASGAVIGGGTPLDDAVAFAQWKTAHRLLQRGAVLRLFNAAALGQLHHVRDNTGSGSPAQDLTTAFWGACHGGQRATAQYLMDLGADRNWIASWNGMTPLDTARDNGHDRLAEWLVAQGCVSANPQ